jgi:mono/diheme cytochrome c family protein
MFKFLIGFVTAVLVLSAVGFGYVRLGFVDPRADVPTDWLESKIAMPSLDAAVDRHAGELQNPLQATDANLIAGMKIYQADCASCHGDSQRPHSLLAEAFYPRAPQFVEDPADMPESQNFYIIQHGIRLSGMPGWKQALRDEQIWQVTTFLSHMDKLSPQVSDLWKATLSGSSVETAAPIASQPVPNGKSGMDMPGH